MERKVPRYPEESLGNAKAPNIDESDLEFLARDKALMDSVQWFAPAADPNNPLDPPDPPDPVKRPAQYTSHPSGVECNTIVGHMNFNLGNAVKYIWRFSSGVDPKIQDLHKAIQYLEFEIDRQGDNHGH